MNINEEMIAINNQLLKASHYYYNSDEEIMSDYEYDRLYDKLMKLEQESGIIFSNSVTQNVGSRIIDGLSKSQHKVHALSLNKTKDEDVIKKWSNNEELCLSWKLDGLTVVITYIDGILKSAVTRGNGIIGEDITEQAKLFSNIPLHIPYKGELIVRSEAIISYSEFEKINASTDNKFKNPRNLVSGTVKSLDTSVLKERSVRAIIFTLVEGGNINSYSEQLDWVESLGFEVVEHEKISYKNISNGIRRFTDNVKNFDYPVDGLVFYVDDSSKFDEIGTSSHHPNYAMAFKWQDETRSTKIRKIEWNKSRTGRLNPIAVFDPVELEGTTVSRASLHNLTYIENMKINIGDEVEIFKANMIIPQIAENHTQSLNNIEDIIPIDCPICHGELTVNDDDGSKFLYCLNDGCNNAHIINHFINVLDIKHIAKKTVDKLIESGIVTSRLDILHLSEHEDEFVKIDGLGKKAFNTITNEINNINPTEAQFMAALGIKGMSIANAKNINKKMNLIKFLDTTVEELVQVNGIGDVLANNIVDYLSNRDNHNEIIEMIKIINFKEEEAVNTNSNINGKTFAITGSATRFKNRKEMSIFIESHGGKVSSVVNKNTDYLVTNDTESGSSKNKKAKELDIAIITDEMLVVMAK